VWVDQRGVVGDTLLVRAGSMLAFRLSRDGRKLAMIERLPNGVAETRIADIFRRVEDRARLEGEFVVTSWFGNGRGLVGFYVPDTAQARACCFVGAELDATTLALRVPSPPPAYQILITFDESPDGSLRCEDGLRDKARSNRTTQDVDEVLLLRRVDNAVPPREVVVAQVQGDCAFSPDGKWVAFTNRDGLFVTRVTLDSTARTVKLAPGATSQVRWMSNGNVIVYRSGRALFSVKLRIVGDAVDASKPRLLFQRDGLFTTWDVWGSGWDVGRDGRLLVWQEPAQSPALHLSVITNLGRLAAQRVGAAPAK
jgi:hypothetical protein